MLAQDWQRLGQERTWTAACTREAADQPGLRGRRLPELMEEPAIERAGSAHRAAFDAEVFDAEVTALVWWRLLNLARARRVHLPLHSAH